MRAYKDRLARSLLSRERRLYRGYFRIHLPDYTRQRSCEAIM